ncbi:MAG: single-stranded DNA-binding protein [bacterium]
MSSRSLNKVMLIGNLTRDPEVRYTPQGTAVATFGLATNRSWSTGDGADRQEETQFHRIVAWSKLAEIVGQLLFKGRKIFIEGRLQTRKWTTPDGQQREMTEIVAENMMVLDTRSREGGATTGGEEDYSSMMASDDSGNAQPKIVETSNPSDEDVTIAEAPKKTTKKVEPKKEEPMDETVSVDDIPF